MKLKISLSRFPKRLHPGEKVTDVKSIRYIKMRKQNGTIHLSHRNPCDKEVLKKFHEVCVKSHKVLRTYFIESFLPESRLCFFVTPSLSINRFVLAVQLQEERYLKLKRASVKSALWMHIVCTSALWRYTSEIDRHI